MSLLWFGASKLYCMLWFLFENLKQLLDTHYRVMYGSSNQVTFYQYFGQWALILHQVLSQLCVRDKCKNYDKV